MGAAINNPAGVWGATSQSDGNGTVVSLVCATAIVNKSVVALSTTEGQIVPAATNQSIPSLVGVAIETGIAGNPINVQVAGVVYGVRKDTASNIAQFDRLTIAATDTATLTNISSATAVTQIKDVGQVVAVAMAAAVTAATTVDVFWWRR